jgi:hypothetical protein
MKFVDQRNATTHNTAEDFAELLSRPTLKDQGYYNQWAGAFPVAFGLTVEELLERENSAAMDIFFPKS